MHESVPVSSGESVPALEEGLALSVYPHSWRRSSGNFVCVYGARRSTVRVILVAGNRTVNARNKAAGSPGSLRRQRVV
ncbi:hypothetical protein UCMB321_3373 [Pseudomonas batumici]|uniref:Uncharacterized protein n=1 Tax=Pseudomonas batumici TaxID=226910 RepID=A0A0C2EVZ7_9PSED|nr:hypothetical protein UCMB321_3373 [Pseudomonas batumici]